MRVFDITPIINSKLAVFPGDTAYERKVSMSFANGQHLDLSSVTSTLHLGAHADSSSHYSPKGVGVEHRNIQDYIGNVQLIDLSNNSEVISRGYVLAEDIKNITIQTSRVLFKTGSFPDPYQWKDKFVSLSADLISHLSKKNVRLIGIDTPSVDKSDSKDLESHNALYKYNMSVLEGICLGAVPAGLYTLIALPLPLQGADASPVRAVLIEKTEILSDDDWELVAVT